MYFYRHITLRKCKKSAKKNKFPRDFENIDEMCKKKSEILEIMHIYEKIRF